MVAFYSDKLWWVKWENERFFQFMNEYMRGKRFGGKRKKVEVAMKIGKE